MVATDKLFAGSIPEIYDRFMVPLIFERVEVPVWLHGIVGIDFTQTASVDPVGRLLQLLIERIDYDGRDGSISITFQPSGIKALADREPMGDAA